VLVLAAVLAISLVAMRPALPRPVEDKKAGTDQTVVMKNNKFNKKDITITVGDTITWDNQDDACTTHTATSDDGTAADLAFDTGDVAGGKKSKVIKFSKEGTIKYHCNYHGSMKGTISVKAKK
jgi:plastocyanin